MASADSTAKTVTPAAPPVAAASAPLAPPAAVDVSEIMLELSAALDGAGSDAAATAKVLHSVDALRKIVADPQAAKRGHIHTVRIGAVESGLLTRIVAGGLLDGDAALLRAFMWLLLNIASGDSNDVEALVQHSLVAPRIVLRFLDPSTDADARESTLWYVANVAGDSAKYRDYCLNIPQLLETVAEIAVTDGCKVSTRAMATFAMMNLCVGKPFAAIERVAVVLPACRRILAEAVRWRQTKETDEDVLHNVLRIISALTDGPNTRIGVVLNSGVMPLVITLLRGVPLPPRPTIEQRPHDYRHELPKKIPVEAMDEVFAFLPPTHLKRVMVGCKDWFYDVVCCVPTLYNRARNPATVDKTLQMEALRCCGNFVTGTDEQTQFIVDNDFVEFCDYLLQTTTDRKCRKECLWSLSNIIAGTVSQQLRVTASADRVHRIIDMAMLDTPIDVRNEAMWVVANAFDGADDVAKCFVDAGGIIVALKAAAMPTLRLCSSFQEKIADLLSAEASVVFNDLGDAADESLPRSLVPCTPAHYRAVRPRSIATYLAAYLGGTALARHIQEGEAQNPFCDTLFIELHESIQSRLDVALGSTGSDGTDNSRRRRGRPREIAAENAAESDDAEETGDDGDEEDDDEDGDEEDDDEDDEGEEKEGSGDAAATAKAFSF